MKYRSSFFRFLAVAVPVAASVSYVSGQSNGIELNRRPLRDFGDELKRDVDSKKIDLSGPFLVEFHGKLDNKGNLDVEASSFMRTEGDPALVENVKRGILAIADAGYFQYLKSFDAREFVLSVEQTSANFSTKIVADLPTEQRARITATALSTIIQLSRVRMEDANATEAQKKDAALLKFMKVQAEGSSMILSFVAPAAEIQKLVSEKLAEQVKNGQ